MCIEREKVDFKSREVNCLKECALALNNVWKITPSLSVFDNSRIVPVRRSHSFQERAFH